MDAVEIGDRIFDASTAGENLDGTWEGQVKKKRFDGVLVLTRQNFLAGTGF